MPNYLSAQELANAAEVEGGVVELLFYGINQADDLDADAAPRELVVAWADLCDAFTGFEPKVYKVMELLDEVPDGD